MTMPPEGIFGIPHGILSSSDERIAFGIGLVALAVAVFYDGELDLAPLSGAAVVGITVALFGSFIAPPAIANEWHIPALVALLVIGGVVAVHRRT
ncbi:hypothetical protein [Haladaptatus sp. DFWS20]|uniref:hypothetical protein n=1 Tax=Haladaptatus sp. DFWS20 TaxID=3403467 RepID=UPI003EBE515C